MSRKVYLHLTFRIKQFFRIFNLQPNFGWTFLAIAILLYYVNLGSNVYYTILFLILVFTFHLYRKDIHFLKKVFPNNWRLVLFIENACVYFLILLTVVNRNIDLIQVVAVFFLVPLSYVKSITKPSKVDSLNFIPNYLLEFKSLYRSKKTGLYLSLLLSTISGFHPFTLFLFAVVTTNCLVMAFNPSENKELLIAYFSKFSLDFKIKKNVLVLNVFLLPTYIVFLCFNYLEIVYLIYFVLSINCFLVLLISEKYKNYLANEPENFYNISDFIVHTICSLAIIPALVMINLNKNQANINIASYVKNYQPYR